MSSLDLLARFISRMIKQVYRGGSENGANSRITAKSRM